MANGKFNRGSSESGRRRDGSRLPGQSAGEGTSGNVVPRPTTKASIRRQQALMRILSDKLPNGLDFSRGTTKGGVRRNFAMMAEMSLAGGGPFSVQLVASPVNVTAATPTQISWATENYDIGDWWASGATLTCPGAATYDVAYTLGITQAVSAATQVEVLKNGASVDAEVFGSGVTSLSKTVAVALTPGDTLAIRFSSTNETFVASGQITVD